MEADNKQKLMTNYDVVKKIIGDIEPVGETNTDNDRFGNLKALCFLVEQLIVDIDSVARGNKDRAEYSMNRSGEYAHKFLSEIRGKNQ